MRFRKIRCKRVRCAEDKLSRLEVPRHLLPRATTEDPHKGPLHDQRLEEMVALFWWIHGTVQPLWHLAYYERPEFLAQTFSQEEADRAFPQD